MHGQHNKNLAKQFRGDQPDYVCVCINGESNEENYVFETIQKLEVCIYLS
jgi:hypothetical protein